MTGRAARAARMASLLVAATLAAGPRPSEAVAVVADGEASEVATALAAVGVGSADEMRSRLFTNHIVVFSDEHRAAARAALPKPMRSNQITQGKLLRRVESIFNQVLEAHRRRERHQVELFLYRDDVPFGMLWRGCVLALSDGLAEPLHDAELAGVIAHELGHSYFMDEMAEAGRAKDARAMRVIELKCDAVALVSLKLLGYDPARYLRGLKRVQEILRRKSLSSGIFQSHPELHARAQFAERLIESLGVRDQPPPFTPARRAAANP